MCVSFRNFCLSFINSALIQKTKTQNGGGGAAVLPCAYLYTSYYTYSLYSAQTHTYIYHYYNLYIVFSTLFIAVAFREATPTPLGHKLQMLGKFSLLLSSCLLLFGLVVVAVAVAKHFYSHLSLKKYVLKMFFYDTK